ncbi:hypothetical protein LB518_22935 [Mesorhizobium sp. BR1-1-16]|uniref:hypothetical protein n=1 Tax=Mesorhizobium sp. BR1-1-16 TaxID=2876653 RepID=UPI001CCF3505|nr:hypothetical protein [Mesorhizobium sp. BR1-1-16]MBZ9939171.1 hypothetical protein [Mesorhizobium sp. BR1-1-16]
MNNFDPDQTPQRRADMDGGLTFDELCIVGFTFLASIAAALLILSPFLASLK